MTYANGLFPGSGLGQAKKGWQGKSVKLSSIYQSVKITVIQYECMIYLL
jgi:hypothetical protein